MFLSTNESGEKKAVVEQLHDRTEKENEKWHIQTAVWSITHA